MTERPRIEDPYTGADLGPAEPERLEAAELETGYDRTTPNPVYSGLPHLWLLVDARGEIVSVTGKSGPEVDEDDREAVHRAIYGRTRRRSPDGIGSGGVTLPARAMGPRIQTPARRPASVLGSHTLTRDPDAHDVGRGTVSGMDEVNHSHTQDKHMTASVPVPKTPERPALTLYDLTDRWLELEAFIDEHQDEILNAGGDLDAVPGLVERLEALEGDLKAKVERVVLFLENRAEIEKARRAQAVKFGRLADLDKTVIANLKAYLVRCQRRAGLPKIETTHCKTSVVRNSQQSIERAKDAQPLDEIHGAVTAGFFPWTFPTKTASEAAELEASLLACIDIEEPPPIYSLNRAKILEIWKAAYTQALAQNPEAYTPANAVPFEVDRQAQAEANRHPVLVALGVTVDQGYHVRIK